MSDAAQWDRLREHFSGQYIFVWYHPSYPNIFIHVIAPDEVTARQIVAECLTASPIVQSIDQFALVASEVGLLLPSLPPNWEANLEAVRERILPNE